MMKRTFDMLFSLIAAIVLFIPALIIALLVRLTSEGPVLYWSERIGLHNQIFRMPKFRTMKIDTPAMATHLIQNPHAYITTIGRFLRKNSLDEIPQLYSIIMGRIVRSFSLDELPEIFNVLVGDMSFVGPRPALFNQHDLIKLRTEKGIHEVIPGLTGWAQINGRDELPIPVKVEFDDYYRSHRNFLFDMQILFMTFYKILKKEGVSH